jgi:dipeptidyl aminopeptidase/acylaminoacyl peptidase
MTRRYMTLFAFLTLVLTWPAKQAYAQSDSGSINGQITDPKGAVIQAATVTITDLATNGALSTKTNAGGQYTFSTLKASRYKIAVSAPGFKETVISGIDLHTQDKTSENIVLEVGSSSDSVEVSANNTGSIVSRVSPTPRLDDYWRVSKIVVFNVRTGEAVRTLEENSGYAKPLFSHDGLRIAFPRFTARKITDEHFVKTLADGHEVKLETILPGTIREMQWMGSGSHLFVSQIVATHGEHSDFDAATGKATAIQGFPSQSESFNVTQNGRSVSFLGESPTEPADPCVWKGGEAHAVATLNPQVAHWDIGSQREISWKNPKDGRTIYGVVVLPPNYQPGTPYKTIVHIHGGPEEAWEVAFNGNWYNYATLLASHGYVVLLPDPRGSEGQGPAFTEANYQDWGGADFADIMAGVDYLVAQGISDPQKLAVGGWSFGGYMTSWTITHTDRFKAAMVGAGVTDLFSMATTTHISPSFLQSYLGELQANAAVYDRESPVRYVQHCQTPVLVLHGEADPRVPISQGQEFYHGVLFLNKDTQMVTYPREPHIFKEQAHQIDSLTRILAWYDAHMGQ